MRAAKGRRGETGGIVISAARKPDAKNYLSEIDPIDTQINPRKLKFRRAGANLAYQRAFSSRHQTTVSRNKR